MSIFQDFHAVVPNPSLVSAGRFVPVIALVGGVGSGKTSLARALAARRRVLVIDGDEIGHDVLKTADVKRLVERRFGESVFDPQGEVNRTALAGLVFGADEERRRARADLEAIVHPEIRRALRKEIDQARESTRYEVILLDAAVLLEAGWNDLCDAVIFVDTPFERRLERVAQSRSWEPGELERREASQLDTVSKREAADEIIDNSRSLQDAVDQLEDIVDRIIGRERPRSVPRGPA